MKNCLILTAVLMAIGATAVAAGQNRQLQGNKQKEAPSGQQERTAALSQRGKLDEYQQLLVISTASQRSNTIFSDADRRDAAYQLAALGFSAADVTALRKRNINAFDAASRFYRAGANSSEMMLLADTVIVGVAQKVEQKRKRRDGFRSAIPFSVVRSLKGSRASGDIVYMPKTSGIDADGNFVELSTDIQIIPGKTYFLAFSKNLYEQWVAQENKQTEPGFNAMLYIAQEVNKDATLLAKPRTPRSGAPFPTISSAEKELNASSISNVKAGGGHAK